MSAGTRPCIDRASSASGDAFRALGLNSLCSWRPTCLRRAWPRLRRSCGVAQCMTRTIHPGPAARNPANPVSYAATWKPLAQSAQPARRWRAPLPEEFTLTRTTALLLFGFVAVPFAALPLAAQAPAKPLTVEAIFAHGPLIGHPPEDLTWSPDGKHLTYDDGGELIDLDPGLKSEQPKPHVLVSRAKLASLSGASDSEKDRDHRDRYK